MESKITLEQLRGFTGSENWYRHWLGILYTDGVKFLADNAGAYWLIDAIASYQKELVDVPFQVWVLLISKDRSAVLQMREDSDKPIRIEQKIAYSDFPIERIQLYLMNGVLLLPSEY